MVASLSVFGGETSMAFFFGKHRPQRTIVVDDETTRRLLQSFSLVTSREGIDDEQATSQSLVSEEALPPPSARLFSLFRLNPKRRFTNNKVRPRSIQRKESKLSVTTSQAEDPNTPLRLGFPRKDSQRWAEEVDATSSEETPPPPLTPNSSKVHDSNDEHNKDNNGAPPGTPDTVSSTTIGLSISSKTHSCSSSSSASTSKSSRKNNIPNTGRRLFQEYKPQVEEFHEKPCATLTTFDAPYPSFTGLSLIQSSNLSFEHPQYQTRMVRDSCRRHLRTMYGTISINQEEGQEVDLYQETDTTQSLLNDIDTAEELVTIAIRSNNLEEAIKIAKMLVVHHQSLSMRSLLVFLYLANDEPNQALDQNMKNLQSGSAHQNTPTSSVQGTRAVRLLLEHGLVQLANQYVDEAVTAWREAVHMSMGLDGFCSPMVALLLSYLGIGHFCTGNLRNSVKLMEESLDMQRQMLSTGQYDVSLNDTLYLLANTMGNLSVLLDQSDEPDRAISLLDEALTLYDSLSNFDTVEASALIRQKIAQSTATPRRSDNTIPSVVDIPGTGGDHKLALEELLRQMSSQSGRTLNTLRTADVQLYEKLRLSTLFGSSDGLPNRSLSPKSIDPSVLVCNDFLMLGPLGVHRWTNGQRVQETVLSWFDSRAVSDEVGRGRESIPVNVDDENIFNANLYLKQIHIQTLKHLERKEIDDAIELLESTLRSHRQKYGKTHHLVGNALQNIGMVHLFAEDYQKALEKFNDAFRIRHKILGINHPDVFDSLTKGALVHFAMGDLWKAHDAFWAIYDRMKACGHPVVYKILNNVGVTTYELGDAVNAMQVFKGALEAQACVLQQKDLCKESIRMVQSARASLLENMGFVSFSCGIEKYALACYNEARVILEEGKSENFQYRLRCVNDRIEYIRQINNRKANVCAQDRIDSLLLENDISLWCQAIGFSS